MGRLLASLTFWKKDARSRRWHQPLDSIIDEWIGASQVEQVTEKSVALPYDVPKGEVSNQRHDTFDPSSQSFIEGQDSVQPRDNELSTGTPDLESDVLEFATELSSLDIAIENSLVQKQKQSVNVGGTAIESKLMLQPQRSLTALDDRDVDHQLRALRQMVTDRQGDLVKEAVMTKGPRRKHVDARQTIRFLARNGGLFREFRYRPSPSLRSAYTQPIELLVIGDVSGSMGRYIAVVLHLLASLEKVAKVTSYIFSDTPTYVGNPKKTGSSFRSMYDDLQKRATSWAFGTRLSVALEQVRGERRYTERTIVLLITDGGFSLIGSDWRDTVKHLMGLHAETDRVIVATPNPALVEEGAICAARLWDVERDEKPAHEIISSPEWIKIARLGLLSRCSDSVIPCSTVEDIENFIDTLFKQLEQRVS